MNSTLLKLQEMGRCKISEPMKFHTTIGTGGPASIFCEPATNEQLLDLIFYAESQKIDYIIIGNGSNLLVSDKGYEGIVICTKSLKHDFSVRGTKITAGAGVNLITLSMKCAELGLSGLEFASGIPGTLGGAVVQNAGAYGSTLADVTEKVLGAACGKLTFRTAEQCGFGYRESFFKRNKEIVLNVTLKLKKDDPAEIKKRMQQLREKRFATQPQERSAGCVFLGSDGFAAGYLIDQCGLKGFSVGGAQISEKHANFFINTGDAVSNDFYELMQVAKESVFEKFGVWLTPEIEFIGEF